MLKTLMLTGAMALGVGTVALPDAAQAGDGHRHHHRGDHRRGDHHRGHRDRDWHHHHHHFDHGWHGRGRYRIQPYPYYGGHRRSWNGYRGGTGVFIGGPGFSFGYYDR